MNDISDIKRKIKDSLGIVVIELMPINEGVMNFTYTLKTNSCDLILKVNPAGREKVSYKEAAAINLCQSHGIKVPRLLFYYTAKNNFEYSFLVYEKLEGESLAVKFKNFDKSAINRLIEQIISNLQKMALIEFNSIGESEDLLVFSHENWKEFIKSEVNLSLNFLTENGHLTNLQAKRFMKYFNEAIKELPNNANKFTWTDLDLSNIIVSDAGNLEGIIDFEGVLSGDPSFALGAFYAKWGENFFSENLLSKWGASQKIIDFYAIVRYLRLIKYYRYPLPTGRKRDDIKTFLPYSFNLFNEIIKA